MTLISSHFIDKRDMGNPLIEPAPNCQFPFRSYHDYVRYLSDLQPEYRWLSRFFAASGEHSGTDVFIYDSIEGSLHARSVTDCSKPKLCSTLMETSATTRLVVVLYDQCWSIDRQIVEAVGEAYHIDPCFFWQTFDHFYAKNDRLCPPEMINRGNFGTLWTFPLPTEQRSLDACYIDAGVNALFLGSSDQVGNTVIIFLRDPMTCAAGFTRENRPSPQMLSGAMKTGTTDGYSQRTLARRYLTVLNRFSTEQIRSADRNLIEYTYPYLHLLAVEVFARLQRQSFLIEQQYYEGASARAQTEALEEGWAIVHDTRLYMTNSQKSLERFAKTLGFKSPQSAEILKDYRTLMGQIRLIQGDLRDYLSRHVGMLALQDSKKSIEQAVTMNGLTKLAFVFIPLNFVTSAFGMNLTNLGTGKAEIWMVVVSCVLLGGLVLAAVAIALSRSKATLGPISDEAGAGSKTVQTLWTLLKSAPKEAFWFLVFMMLNTTEDCRDFSIAVNRDPFTEWTERDHNDYPNSQPRFEFPTFNRLSNGYFWERRARRMNRVLVGLERDRQGVKKERKLVPRTVK